MLLGTCDVMCPVAEQKMRIRERLIHPLESVQFWQDGDVGSAKSRSACTERLVKTYRRSAAGQSLTDLSSLRPFATLMQTVRYLNNLYSLHNRASNVPYSLLYEFVSDRLRSVRQDMILQQLNARETCTLLANMMYFYLHSDYRCSTEPCSSYDVKLHEFQLEECMNRWADAYSVLPLEIRQWNTCFPAGDRDYEPKSWNDLRISYLIYTMYRSMRPNCTTFLLAHETSSSEVRLPLVLAEILQCYRLNNFVRFFRLISSACDSAETEALFSPIVRLSIVRLFRSVRFSALRTLAHGYGSKTLTVPLQTVKHWLMFDTIQHTHQACKTMGLQVSDNDVRFHPTLLTSNGLDRESSQALAKCDWFIKE